MTTIKHSYIESKTIFLSKALPLRINFLWTLIGNSVYAGCQWAMLVVLAKLGTPEMVGQFALGLAVTAPIILVTNLGLRAVQTTDAKGEFQFGHYLALRLISSFLALIIILGVIVWSGYRGQMAWIILAIGGAKVVESVSDVFHGLFQRHERLDRAARSLMLKGPLSLLALGFGVWQTGEVLWGTVGLLAVWFLILVAYDLPNGIWLLKLKNPGERDITAKGFNLKKIQPCWEWRELCSLAWLAFPLGMVAMLISLNSNIPRYFIESFRGTRELGIYAAIAYLMAAGGMVINALDKAVTPRQANYYAEGNKKAFITLLVKLLGIASFVGLGGVLVAALAGRPLLTLIYRPEYAEHADILVMLMVAGWVSYMNYFLGAGMTAARHFRIQLPLFIMVNLSLTFFSYTLIPPYGLWGAALAVTLTGIVQMVLSSLVVFRAIRRLA